MCLTQHLRQSSSFILLCLVQAQQTCDSLPCHQQFPILQTLPSRVLLADYEHDVAHKLTKGEQNVSAQNALTKVRVACQQWDWTEQTCREHVQLSSSECAYEGSGGMPTWDWTEQTCRAYGGINLYQHVHEGQPSSSIQLTSKCTQSSKICPSFTGQPALPLLPLAPPPCYL
eukprot:384670-Pelagomonas_calceolata.AAC.5